MMAASFEVGQFNVICCHFCVSKLFSFRVKVPVGFFVLNLFKKALRNIILLNTDSCVVRVCVCAF